MTRYFLWFLMMLITTSLTGCAFIRSNKLDPSKENWMHQVDVNQSHWTRGADRWFFTGDPNKTELANRRAPFSAAMSTLSVRVPDFTKIKVDGDFQVQLYGSDDHNSVTIYGPNDGVRDVSVQVRGDTLCLDQVKKVSLAIDRVIIRIGVRNLHKLIHLGCGKVEGIRLKSSALDVLASGRGNIYLSGQLNLLTAASTGSGKVSIFGANTRSLGIRTARAGTVNVSGDVGIRSIVHRGIGDVNVIGANSPDVVIDAAGSGKVGINGMINLRDVRARDRSRVYAYPINSGVLRVSASHAAHVGLAGTVQRLYVHTIDRACFSGRDLCTREAFVKAQGNSHISVTASKRIFASASGMSSIYFFGSNNVLSSFVSGDGTVIPIWSDNGSSCTMTYRPLVRKVRMVNTSYKGEG